jgi:hypothetical protein
MRMQRPSSNRSNAEASASAAALFASPPHSPPRPFPGYFLQGTGEATTQTWTAGCTNPTNPSDGYGGVGDWNEENGNCNFEGEEYNRQGHKARRAATESTSHCDRAGVFNFHALACTMREGLIGPSLAVPAPTVGRPGARRATLAIRATRLVRSGVTSSSLAVQASSLVLVSMRKSLWI